MKVPDVLLKARTFVYLNLNADFDTMKFIEAKLQTGIWEVKCAFKDRNLNAAISVTLCISDQNGEVTSFSTDSISAGSVK